VIKAKRSLRSGIWYTFQSPYVLNRGLTPCLQIFLTLPINLLSQLETTSPKYFRNYRSPSVKHSPYSPRLRDFQRCGHPAQQHGLRMPPRILSMPTSMRRLLVASCLAEMTQQIHSFRASGVISAQRLLAVASDSMALRKSAGSLWTVPSAIS